ncbi:MAG: pyruvate kinase [Candidatus Pacebacteria bacterium]|nr:pyruvate kinase [Candidatus Paceibacterota bacterium]MDR3583225.1 pyruvate kinase [Candidatus Paceibacterota bacterium]
MNTTKRTKIVATLGPATGSKEKIREIIELGVNVARINFSHGTHESNGQIIDYVKELRQEMGMAVGIMADLQGPRIRTVVDEDVEIEKGERIYVYDSSVEKSEILNPEIKIVGLDWPGIVADIEIGNDILIEDGLLRINVVEKGDNYLVAKVEDGGVVKNHKGVNIPDAKLKIGAVTEKDEVDLKFALGKGVDFVALSFVANAAEIIATREKIKKMLGRDEQIPLIVSKIERKEAIKNIVEIIKATDAVMVARGDLGIEMEESKVVIYQKEIISRCLRNATPVIVATQMLNSMIENPRPTRAEVSDVSNAVIDHTDSVMLSGETANGKYPAEAVRVMRDIILKTEKSPFDILAHGFLGDKSHTVSAAIAHSAHELLKDTNSKAIVAASTSGFSARMVARHRPDRPVWVMTNNESVHYQMSLVWGVETFVLPECRTLDELIDRSIDTLLKNNLVEPKERVIIVAGRPGALREHMSLVKVEEV